MLITATTFEQTAAPATPHELGELAYRAFCAAHLGGMYPIPRAGRGGDWAAFARIACEWPAADAYWYVRLDHMPPWDELPPATRQAFEIAADAAAAAPVPEKHGFGPAYCCAWALCRNPAAPGSMACHSCPDSVRFNRRLARRNEARARQALRAMSPPDRAYAAFVAYRVPGPPNPAPTNITSPYCGCATCRLSRLPAVAQRLMADAVAPVAGDVRCKLAEQPQ